MNNEKGLKQKIKDGELSPDDAIKLVEKSETPSDNFLRWAKGYGRVRYAQALKVKESETETVETTVFKKKAKKKTEK